MLKRIGFLVLDEQRSLKFQSISEYICYVLDRGVCGLGILVETNLFLAVKLQQNLTK